MKKIIIMAFAFMAIKLNAQQTLTLTNGSVNLKSGTTELWNVPCIDGVLNAQSQNLIIVNAKSSPNTLQPYNVYTNNVSTFVVNGVSLAVTHKAVYDSLDAHSKRYKASGGGSGGGTASVDTSINIQKEYTVVTATGTPTANVGEKLRQFIIYKSNTLTPKWLNLNTGVLLTTDPIIANLCDKPECNVQQWAMYGSGIAFTTGGVFGATFNISTGTTVTTGSTYTVPAGKILRLYQLDVLGYYSGVAANFSLGGTVSAIYNSGALAATSARAISVSSYAGFSGTGGASGMTGGASTTLPYGCDIPAGSVVGFTSAIGAGGAGYNNGNITLRGILINQ